MKTIRAIALSLLVLAASTSGTHGQVTVRVKNLLAAARQAAVVEVGWRDLHAAMPTISPASVAVSDLQTKKRLTMQVVDEDRNGTPEKLLFQSGFRAGEEKDFRISFNSVAPPVTSLTDVRFVPPREDLAWENDCIAFRMYGPPLAKEGSNNGIDVWTKRVRTLIVKKWYEGEEENPKISYHEDHGEGADYFTVGKTLGAGACALLQADTLLQPGVFAAQTIVATGPLRGIFELRYDPVVYGGHSVTGRLRITLDAGSNLNKIEAIFVSESGKGSASVVAGIVKRPGTRTSRDEKAGWIGLWGPTTDSEETGSLGTGIVIPKQELTALREDPVHAFASGHVEFGKTFTYYAGAGWTRSGDFKTADDWNAYLAQSARRIASPLVVQIVKQ